MTQRTFLVRMNFFIYLLLVIGFLILQTTVFSYFPLSILKPDILLIVAVYFGFHRNLLEGTLFVTLSSYLYEVHSGAANHYFLSMYLYVFLISKLISRTLVIPDLFSILGIVTGLTVLRKIGLLILFGLSGRAMQSLLYQLLLTIPAILVNGMIGPIAFRIFEWIDVLTQKVDASQQDLDTELRVEI